MTISATYIGQSTIQVSTTYNAGDSYTTRTPFLTIAKTVADAITGAQPGTNGSLSGTAFTNAAGITAQASSGWTLFDSFWGNPTQGYNSASTYAYTDSVRARMYTQVFRSLNEDGVTYKNAIFAWDLKSGELNITTCEYWDTSAVYNSATPTISANRVGTNFAYTFFNSSPVNWNNTFNDLIIFVSPRWCLAHTYICNEPGGWAGVVEFQREDPTDTTARNIPCWGWISSSLGPQTGGDVNNACYNTLITVPRTASQLLGINAAVNWGADYGTVVYPNKPQGTGVAPMSYQLGLNYFAANAWDQTRKLIMSIKPIFNIFGTAAENKGIIHGLKTLAPVGANMQKIKVPVDSQGNSSRTGTDRSHWLLNQHSKSPIPGTGNYPYNWVSNPKIIKTDVASPGGVSVAIGIMTGTWFYYSDGARLYKYNTVTGVLITLTGWDTTNWASITDMKYDHERYIYISNNSNQAYAIIAWDTCSDTGIVYNNTTYAAGGNCIEITGTRVWIGLNAANTSPNIVAVAKLDPTAAMPASLTYANNIVCTSMFAESVGPKCMMLDNYENLHMSPTNTTAVAYRLVKATRDKSDGTNAGFAQSLTGLSVIAATQGLINVSDDLFIYTYAAASATAQYYYQMKPYLDAAAVNQSGSSVTCSTAYGGTTVYLRFHPLKIQGVTLVHPTLSGTSTGNYLSLYHYQTSVGSPTTVVTNSSADVMAASTFNSAQGWQGKWCDGCRIIISTGAGLRIYNNLNGGTSAGGIGGTVNYTPLGQMAIPA